ncbi:uncharacterized protein LOC130167094 isoform X1 [Seriola aureovittata]|uniref:uncharacterized protein LOC130167094 isoform X1 n=1 Tax=Seriola aureovittata TaxID=2871759 RepID=UPI0024BD77CB|nr:uncharacterized protein LOC130167094 isoform X1 [Seriola aureovittata]XP_056229040.1 uncharacterized protein LOC130167094 isoform X1 [Seriola aureovittata]XP_056229042.1 uncharacterized protein LOC130167094 isoform X1 [Seriola aureovittata]XP_056229043.1 uncharacterized protein LOC130167094 isoform X1 [Seriola aureovittata]
MNPLDWEDAFRRLQRHLGPNNSFVNNSMGNALKTNIDYDTYCEYSRHTVDEPQNSMGVNLGWEELSSSTLNFYSKEPEVEDPDGEPLEIDEEDSELVRKRKELREIEERIILKKAAIALKTVEPLVKKTTPPGLSCHEHSAKCKGETLRDRVNLILQQRHSLNFFSKVPSPKKRMNSSSLLEEHPLKLRVKALMKQRCWDLCVLPTNTEVPDVTLPPPTQSITSAAIQENNDNKGFQRFLSVLNKGVDIDLLSRIVNDDSEDLALGEELLDIQPPPVENKSEPGESQQSNSEASMPGHSWTDGGERKTDPPSRERSQNERLSLPGGEDMNDRRDSSFGSSIRSKSPLAVKKKEEEQPKVDEQHEHLQNILKTLGLSLEVEEMSRLADRTQERLYGKKHEGRCGADSRGEQESLQRGSLRHHMDSSSSSSSSSSSRSTSRSFSPSPSRHCHSHSRDSKQKRSSECRSRDGLTCQDGNQDSKEAMEPRDIDKDRKDSKEISTYHHHPYPQEQSYSQSHPASASAFSDYSMPQYSQYTAYHSGTYSAAPNSYSTYTQGAIPPSLDSSEYPYPQNTDFHFPGSIVGSHMVYPHHDSFEDMNLLVNPDLSKSEGQIGSAGHRCLRVISTKPSTNKHCLKQVSEGHKQKAAYIRKGRAWFCKLRERKTQLRKQAIQAKQNKDSVGEVKASQGDEHHSEARQSEDEERQPTEEEIKVNLRKKLEAFNQKVKQQVTQPVTSLTSQTG